MTKSREPDIRLGRMELQIMNAVWERGRATVQEVKDDLSVGTGKRDQEGKNPAYTTVLTMMRKLELKGYLTHVLSGRTFVYLPALSRQRVRKSLLADILDRLFEGSPALLLNNLISEQKINEKDLSEIRKLVKERSPNHE
jgi:BlaI family transcriptional regulator, penicillinase repressor